MYVRQPLTPINLQVNSYFSAARRRLEPSDAEPSRSMDGAGDGPRRTPADLDADAHQAECETPSRDRRAQMSGSSSRGTSIAWSMASASGVSKSRSRRPTRHPGATSLACSAASAWAPPGRPGAQARGPAVRPGLRRSGGGTRRSGCPRQQPPGRAASDILPDRSHADTRTRTAGPRPAWQAPGMDMATPRIPPLPAEDRDERTEELLRSLRRDPDGTDLNIFATLAHHPRLLKRWSAFGGVLLYGGELPPRERELLILRTAANCGADYEWGQHAEHRRRGRAVRRRDRQLRRRRSRTPAGATTMPSSCAPPTSSTSRRASATRRGRRWRRRYSPSAAARAVHGRRPVPPRRLHAELGRRAARARRRRAARVSGTARSAVGASSSSARGRVGPPIPTLRSATGAPSP